MPPKKKQNRKPKSKTARGLGRGLSALLGATGKEYADISTGISAGNFSQGTGWQGQELPIEYLLPNPYQPRFYFDEQKSADLIQSIKERGILQPLLVRQRGKAQEYEIIAGERRWRAAQAAELHKIPVIIRKMSDREALEIALIENIQHHDLSPIEEARGYKRLIDEFNHTQEQLGHIIGKSRSHVANIMRLLVLPETVQKLVAEGKLSMGHARALIKAEGAESLAKRILREGLSVRQVEQLARAGKNKKPLETKSRVLQKDADTIALENDLSLALGLKVSIDFNSDESGALTIRYKNLEQLDDICQRLNGRSVNNPVK